MTLNIQHAENKNIWFITGANTWISWTKPLDVNFVHIFAVGGGGGGAYGLNTVGGGGGGSGCYTSFIAPAMVLADTLYIQTGEGGAGGIASSATIARSGTNTYISTIPFTSSIGSGGTLYQYHTIITARGGVNGSSSVGGNYNTFLPANQYGALISTGIHTTRGGAAGQAGGSSGFGNGANNSYEVVCGGGGGGGPTSTVGGVTIGGPCGSLLGNGNGSNPTGTSGNGSTGLPGTFSLKPLQFFGGNGGGGGNSTGGRGGDGALGSGGGGGGGSQAGTATAGNGGRGGDGFVIISCW